MLKRHYQIFAVSTKEDVEKIKKHLKLVFHKENLMIRIYHFFGSRYSLWVSCTSFEADLLSFYLSNAKIENVKIWNY